MSREKGRIPWKAVRAAQRARQRRKLNPVHPSIVRGADHTVVGVNIRRLRIFAGYTQCELGRQANLSHVTIGKAECGLSLPWPCTLGKLAKALRCSIADFYGPMPPDFEGAKHAAQRKAKRGKQR